MAAGVPDFVFLGAMLSIVVFVGVEGKFSLERFVMSRSGGGDEDAATKDQSVR